MLPVPFSHMENVLSLQTRQIVLCCCFSPEAQPSIRRVRLPTCNSTEHFVRSNAVYESWEVFEKRLFHKEVNFSIWYRNMLEQAIVIRENNPLLPFTAQWFFSTSHCY